jgi:hypothetical protein
MSIVAITGEIVHSTVIPPDLPSCSNKPISLQTLKIQRMQVPLQHEMVGIYFIIGAATD